jgi:hypothetical protein
MSDLQEQLLRRAYEAFNARVIAGGLIERMDIRDHLDA